MFIVSKVQLFYCFLLFPQVVLRTKMAEAKFHEEKLRLQQKHDAAVQKVNSFCLFFLAYSSEISLLLSLFHV